MDARPARELTAIPPPIPTTWREPMPAKTLISITCQSCGATFKVDARHAGKRGRCPVAECQAAYTVPAGGSFEDAVEQNYAKVLNTPKSSRRTSTSVARAQKQFGLTAGFARVTRSWKRGPQKSATTPSTAASSRASTRRSTQVAHRRAARPIAQRLWPLWSACGIGVVALVAVVLWGTGAVEPPAVQAARPDTYQQQIAPFIKKYCVECHGAEEPEGGIALHSFDSETSVLKARKVWEKVLPMLQIEAMPPVEDGRERPTHDEYVAVTSWLEDKLYNIDCKIERDPGRVTIRRLNRSEYNNTIRDLLGVNLTPADEFPSDDVGYGFDNIGDVLSVSPLLMEKYLAAAEKISERAISTADPAKAHRVRYADKRLKPGGSAENQGDRYAITSSGHVAAEHFCPREGEYLLRAQAAADQAGSELAKMEFSIDGKGVHTFEVTGRREPHEYEFKLRLTRGVHKFTAAFVNDYYAPKGPRGNNDRNLYIGWLEVAGPLDLRDDDFPESHRRLIVARPGGSKSVVDAARENLRPLVRRAFRRSVTDDEVNRFVPLVELAISQGESFERGMQLALQGVLCSPNFLFRVETDPNPHDPKARHEVSPFELATRLSYFLWSSMPDDELLSLAEKNELRKPDVIQAQVRRLLKDSRSHAFVENFALQWLNLRSLDELTPDPEVFPTFSPQLRADMLRETSKFFEHILREDLSTLELLDGKFTFVNERLAKHYGIPGIQGEEFQKVSLEKVRGRAGLLTQASILTVTSNPSRTSPVKRGKWIMENILGTAPPPPPPNVPSLEETQKAQPGASLREQLKIHRENAVCNSCHRQMDDLGFGFEHFDAIGRWRDRDGQHDIDASGVLPNGDKFNGSTELIAILKGRSQQFHRCLTEKLMTYAIGRGLEYYDRCAVDKILEAHAADGYRFSTLITQIVLSEPFQMRRGDGKLE
jgi:mono/diheme cytochrome c family protein